MPDQLWVAYSPERRHQRFYFRVAAEYAEAIAKESCKGAAILQPLSDREEPAHFSVAFVFRSFVGRPVDKDWATISVPVYISF